MIEERIEELEDGFRDLLNGLRAVIQDLRDENRLLAARLEERRMMDIEQRPVVEVLDVHLPKKLPSLPRKREPKLVDKKCERCPAIIHVLKKTRFCQPCFSELQGERSRKMHEAKERDV